MKVNNLGPREQALLLFAPKTYGFFLILESTHRTADMK